MEAVLQDAIINRDGYRTFALARVERRRGRCSVALSGRQGAGVLASITTANSLLTVPENVAQVEKGDKVRVMLLDWNEGTGAI
jgi:molybdopterin biosynthesis enzyme